MNSDNLAKSSSSIDVVSPKILVVDDEDSIRKVLTEILIDEGYQVISASDGIEALKLLRSENPELVLLDIWMPGMDGLEVLKRIRELNFNTSVVMISGHATISTAVEATRIGASDFIEKPFDLEGTLETINRIIKSGSKGKSELGSQIDVASDKKSSSNRVLSLTRRSKTNYKFDTRAFSSFPLKGKKIPQKSIKSSAVLYGQGLHSGKKSGLSLEPLPPNHGIHFVGVSNDTPVPAHIDFVRSTGFATTLRLGGTSAGTIEHLMSALCALGITNLLVKCNGEVPVMDGSSAPFISLLNDVGIEEQSEDFYAIAVDKKIKVGKGHEWIQIEPAEELSIDYTLSYPDPVGVQRMKFTLNNIELYTKDISNARTFGFLKDIERLQQNGLAQGGRFDNFVLVGDDGPLNGDLRYPNEFVRHKILDAIGDLYLLGRPLQGKITACMTGHSDNIQLLKEIQKNLY